MRKNNKALLIAVLAASLLVSCKSIKQKNASPAEAPLMLERATFKQLPGWADDDVSQAISALNRSCARMMKEAPAAKVFADGLGGTFSDWHAVCLDAANITAGDLPQARAFFENRFSPYRLRAGEHDEGLFTGYYEPVLRGSRERKQPYTVPLLGRPSDLIDIHLGDFRADLQGERIVGRVENGKLVPYHDRKAIEAGALTDKATEVLWVDSAVDAFFLHIQGSGRVDLDDGTTIKVGYAAQNGRPYTAIGAELVKMGEIAKEDISMQSIRAWMEKNPDKAAEVMNLNSSYVFFREAGPSDELGAVGAEGVPLTPGRSMAVDRKRIFYGAPIFIDVTDPEDPQKRLQRLMIAQDTGGAIRGAIRGDVFWGSGPEAAHKAGLMKSRGQAWILLPNDAEIPEKKWYFPWWLGPVDFLLGRESETP